MPQVQTPDTDRELIIGVLSDPHRRSDLQKAAIEKLIAEGARYLLHAGDFVLAENIETLAGAGLPYAAVFGNNDSGLFGYASRYRIAKEPYYLKAGEITVKLMHMPYFMSPDCDLVIYGHTHIFAAEQRDSTLYLNPGEICAREKASSECALLKRGVGGWTLEHLYRQPRPHSLWHKKIYRFR